MVQDQPEVKAEGFYSAALKRLFRDRGAIVGLLVLGAMIFAAVFAPYLAPHEPNRMNARLRLQPPGAVEGYPLGTDEMGRCILTRIFFGARLSLRVGFISTAIGVGVGVTIGMLGGFYRTIDNILLRSMDIMMAIPSVLLALAIVAVLGPGLNNVMIAVGIGIVPVFARVTRSQVLSLSEQTFVEAARSSGASDGYIMLRHILPNCIPIIIVFGTLYLATAIMTASILSFLGFGVRPPTAEWGMMANTGRGYFLQAPHVSSIPSIAILIAILCLNLVGDALRDALDPRLRT